MISYLISWYADKLLWGTGVTEACFCIAIEGRPLGGGSSRGPGRSGRGSRVLARERGSEMPARKSGIAVTEQWDEKQRRWK